MAYLVAEVGCLHFDIGELVDCLDDSIVGFSWFEFDHDIGSLSYFEQVKGVLDSDSFTRFLAMMIWNVL